MLVEYWTREGRGQISLSFCSWSIDVNTFNGRYKTRYWLCSCSCIKIFRESNRWYYESQEDFQTPLGDSESWYQTSSWFSQRSRGLRWCRSCWRLSNPSVYYWGHLSFCRRCWLLVQSKTRISFDFKHRGWNCSFKWKSQRINVAKEDLRRFDSNWQTKAFFVDNEAAIKLAHNPEMQRTKHIETRHFYVKECVQETLLEVERISSQDQLADIMTKSLFKLRFRMLCQAIGLSQEDVYLENNGNKKGRCWNSCVNCSKTMFCGSGTLWSWWEVAASLSWQSCR